ncbi:hypothetical protein AB0D92_30270 [Streptomyces parvus]|uniref:hypothetical protein n=1 Tax=Streptomyces parvus TaxID=66428 RepID=UPI0033F6A549
MNVPAQTTQFTPQQAFMAVAGMLTITAFSAALFGNEEQSRRGFRLLSWLERRMEGSLPAEPDR